MVQNPANPQTFNRYSYCLNNPLKYTDPSGNEVVIDGTNVETFYNYINDPMYMGMGPGQNILNLIGDPLFQAYDVVRSSDLSFAQDLESASRVVNVVFGSVNGDSYGQTIPTNIIKAAGQIFQGKSNQVDYTITLAGATSGLAAQLGHELYHAADPWVSDSIQEELNAYQFGDRVNDFQIGSKNQYGLSGYNPNSRDNLLTVRGILDKMGNQVYNSLDLFPVTNRFMDFHNAASQGLVAVMPSWLYQYLQVTVPRDAIQ